MSERRKASRSSEYLSAGAEPAAGYRRADMRKISKMEDTGQWNTILMKL